MLTSPLRENRTESVFNAALSACALPQALVNPFGANLTALITGRLLKRKQHAVFLDSCSHHCSMWDLIRIDGDIVHVAFWRWWNNTVAGKPTKQLWKQGKAFPCAACCKPN